MNGLLHFFYYFENKDLQEVLGHQDERGQY